TRSKSDWSSDVCSTDLKGKHIDFEVKETKNKILFPLSNVHDHQIKHMEDVAKHGGICFIIIRFTVHDENYYIPFETFLSIWQERSEERRVGKVYGIKVV